MKRQQFILIGGGLVLLIVLFFLAPTTPKAPAVTEHHHAGDGHDHGNDSAATITTAAILASYKEKLTPSQLEYVTRLENTVVRGDVKDQTLHSYHQLAKFWRDSARSFLPYAFYTGEAAKLENSEKNLTFAANLFLGNLQVQEAPALKTWMAGEAKTLFEKVLELNPANDSAKVGLGSCYFFGNLGATPMEGILKIREVAEKDPENMYAQFMLGVGGMMSGQLDKAAERFEKVVKNQPDNLEALLRLAEVYELQEKKAEAVEVYEQSKKLINNPQFLEAVNERIKSLK